MSLYRKYRPQTFEDVVGQDHIAHTLRNALSSDPLRVAHAYLFCGPRGTGKTTSARLLAKCVNCENGPTPTPCNECDFCTRVRDNQPVMDLIEIDAASNTGVDNVRENIIEKVNSAPAQGRYRVYIIDEVHMLSTSSFNALLKTLEEPPAHAIFVLATTDAHKVPATILSRCQRFDFRRVGPADIVGRLQYVAEREGIDLALDAARLIAITADGALRDALTLLEQVAAFSPDTISVADVRLVLGTVSQELLAGLMDAVAAQNPALVLEHINNAVEEGASFSQLTRDLTAYCRDLLLLTVGYESNGLLTDSEKHHRHRHADLMGRAHLMDCVEALRTAEKEMRQSTDHRLLLELTLVRACEPAPIASAQAAPPQAQARPVAAPQTPRSQPAWREPEERTAPPARPVAPPKAPETFEVEPVAVDPAFVPGHENVAPPVVEDEAPPVEYDAGPGEMSMPVAPILEPEPVATPPVRKKGRRIHNIDEFVELWPHLLIRFKKRLGVTAVAYLHNARPGGLTDEEAILEFTKEFHYEKAIDAAKGLPLEQMLNECMATPRRLTFRLAKPTPPPEPEPEPEPDYSGDDLDEFEGDVLKLAQEMFSAQVVGRSGQG